MLFYSKAKLTTNNCAKVNYKQSDHNFLKLYYLFVKVDYRKLTSFTTSLQEASIPVSSAVLSISDFCKIAATLKKKHYISMRFVYDIST